MQKSDPIGQSTSPPSTPNRSGDRSARLAGILLIVTAIATIFAVIARVAADADQPTLAESLSRIALNRELYATGGAARLISGLTLIVAARMLASTWIIRERLGTPLVPALFAVSGLFTLVSGGCALALAVIAPDVTGTAIMPAPDTSQETIAYLRWFTGKIGFAAAGLALLVAAKYQWRVGGSLRYIAPVSALIGIAMQFIWIDSATFMHRINGPAFVVWLTVIGVMLATGRVERHFQRMSGRSAENSAS